MSTGCLCRGGGGGSLPGGVSVGGCLCLGVCVWRGVGGGGVPVTETYIQSPRGQNVRHV